MKKSIKKISWLSMVKKFESLGYSYTADALFLPNGYKRKQNIYRFDYNYKKNTKQLKASDIKKIFNNEITVYNACCQYAPELTFIYATNRIYLDN